MNSEQKSPEFIEQIRELWLQGYSTRKIAARLQCSTSTVRKYCDGLKKGAKREMGDEKRNQLLRAWC